MRFRHRVDAGRHLATHLSQYAGRPDVLVLGLPRGGVPVAAEVAAALHATLDVFLVRKLGVPGHEELAMGAVAEGGIEVLHDAVIRQLGIPRTIVERTAAWERMELERRVGLYRGVRARPAASGHVVIVVDDGLATGATMEAAVTALRTWRPARIVVAVPVGSREACARLATLADELVCPQQPEPFSAVGQWYEDFSETSDAEVRELIRPTPVAEEK